MPQVQRATAPASPAAHQWLPPLQRQLLRGVLQQRGAGCAPWRFDGRPSPMHRMRGAHEPVGAGGGLWSGEGHAARAARTVAACRLATCICSRQCLRRIMPSFHAAKRAALAAAAFCGRQGVVRVSLLRNAETRRAPHPLCALSSPCVCCTQQQSMFGNCCRCGSLASGSDLLHLRCQGIQLALPLRRKRRLLCRQRSSALSSPLADQAVQAVLHASQHTIHSHAVPCSRAGCFACRAAVTVAVSCAWHCILQPWHRTLWLHSGHDWRGARGIAGLRQRGV